MRFVGVVAPPVLTGAGDELELAIRQLTVIDVSARTSFPRTRYWTNFARITTWSMSSSHGSCHSLNASPATLVWSPGASYMPVVVAVFWCTPAEPAGVLPTATVLGES